MSSSSEVLLTDREGEEDRLVLTSVITVFTFSFMI